jgi:hypothetical protein
MRAISSCSPCTRAGANSGHGAQVGHRHLHHAGVGGGRVARVRHPLLERLGERGNLHEPGGARAARQGVRGAHEFGRRLAAEVPAPQRALRFQGGRMLCRLAHVDLEEAALDAHAADVHHFGLGCRCRLGFDRGGHGLRKQVE